MSIIESVPPQQPEAAVPAEAPKVYPCPECGKIMGSPAGLGRHRATAHSVKSKTRRKPVAKQDATVINEEAMRGRMLRAAFPDGQIRADAALITDVTLWLDAGVVIARRAR